MFEIVSLIGEKSCTKIISNDRLNILIHAQIQLIIKHVSFFMFMINTGNTSIKDESYSFSRKECLRQKQVHVYLISKR